MVKFHGTLSEETVHFRYFGLQKLELRVAHERLTRICFNDYDREIALVAVRQAAEHEGKRDHRRRPINEIPRRKRSRVRHRHQ